MTRFLFLISLLAWPGRVCSQDFLGYDAEGLKLKRDQSSVNLSSASQAPEQIQVWVFLSARCPCSNSHVQKLITTAKEWGGLRGSRHFEFVGVHSNQDESPEEGRKYFESLKLPFAVSRDVGARWADRLGALKTPHVFVESLSGKILYQGGIDDSHDGLATEKNYLRDALRELSQGIPVSREKSRSLGCVITRKAKS
jgi:hypothetical protein